MLIAGKIGRTSRKRAVTSPYDGREVGVVWEADAKILDEALEAAVAGKEILARLTPYRRFEILRLTADTLLAQKEEWARLISLESGKTLKEAATEVERAHQTLTLSAEEAKRIHGETVPLDAAPRGEGKTGFYVRVPVGIVLAITPFNFPLNLACHKVGPAIAAGNAVIFKPSSSTPLTGVKLGELLLESGLPPEGISVLIGSGETVGERLAADARIRVISFTGSPEVGERLTQVAGLKRLLLELGSNSSVIYDDMPIPDSVIRKTVAGAFAQAGQVCISVQKLYFPKRRREEILPRLIEATTHLRVGDPLDPATDVGPMITDSAADRVEQWIEEAVKSGAERLTPWKREGRLIHPTLLLNADESLAVCAKEAFAPLLVAQEVESFEEALARVNASQFGLQLGVFTNRLDYALEAVKSATVGCVLINEIPAFRVDLMPYGGMKRSGLGREGPRFAIEEMTDLKLISLNPAPE